MWSLVAQAECWCILLYSAHSSFVDGDWLWGDHGPWRDRRDSGTYYCNLYFHPSLPSTYVGAIVMVTCGTDRLLDHSAVLRPLILQNWVSILGRSGHWWYTRTIGIFCCSLSDHSSRTITPGADWTNPGGDWYGWRDAGIFHCRLTSPPSSWTLTVVGAYSWFLVYRKTYWCVLLCSAYSSIWIGY